MDYQTRQHFGVQAGATVNFTVKPVGWIGTLQWAYRGTDPGLRIAAQLAVISLVLGFLSFVIALSTALPWAEWDRVIRGR